MTAKKTEQNSRSIHERLHAVMSEVDYVQKTHKVEFKGTSYAVVTHDAVTAKVRPVLVKHGVIYYPQNLVHTQNGNRTEVSLDIVFVNVDNPDDKVAIPSFGYGIDQGDKGPGKAVSYAVKYALLKALGLETGEDADIVGEVKHEEPPVRQMSKGDARPEYKALVDELQQQQSIPDLEQWGARNKARLGAMPADWQEYLRNEYAEHKQALTQRTAA